jgi:hypothetical protein
MDVARARLPWLVWALVLTGCATTAKPVVSYPDAAPPPEPPPLSASLPPPVEVPALAVPPPTPEEPPVTGTVPTPPSATRRPLRTPPRAPAVERPAAPAAPVVSAPAPAPPSAPQVASVPPVAAVTPPATVPVLAPQLSAEEEDRLTQQARSQIEGAEKVLSQIEKSRLRRTDQSTLATVLDFLAKAREAMVGRDYQRAATLADKARVLAEDLTRAVR